MCALRTDTPAPDVQILFLAGLTLIIGPQKTFYFFARKQKLRGTLCFIGGILLVFFKWPFVGVILETFGFLNLFGCVSCPPRCLLRPFVFYLVFVPHVSTLVSLPCAMSPSHQSSASFLTPLVTDVQNTETSSLSF